MKNRNIDKISIVTICFNEEKTIEKTLQSVYGQTYSNYEYIIKDAGSTDSTNEIIERYKTRFEEKGCRFIHIQNSDSGIYDAMNIAVKECKGSWINYMNAGDRFYNEYVLEDIFNDEKKLEADIIYGHTCYELRNGATFIVKNNHHNLMQGTGICQQVCFYKAEVLKQRKFLTKYKILGDFEYLVNALNQGKRIQPVNIIVAKYNREGISSVNTYLSYVEKCEILNRKMEWKIGIKKKVDMIFTKCFPEISDLLFCIHTSKSM